MNLVKFTIFNYILLAFIRKMVPNRFFFMFISGSPGPNHIFKLLSTANFGFFLLLIRSSLPIFNN